MSRCWADCRFISNVPKGFQSPCCTALASRGVGWSETRTSVSFEEESYAASELADDYEYSAYNDAYDEYDELGPYYDYDDEDAYDSEYGGGYDEDADVDESLYADYYDEYESSRR